MLGLVIDTALGYLGIGVAHDAELLSYVVMEKPSTVTSLAVPAIKNLLESTGHKKEQLDEIIVAAGPGTFTGLRTGLSLAKGLGMALDIPLVPVSTLDAMVHTVQKADGILAAAIDGKNSNLYFAEYTCRSGVLKKTVSEMVLKAGEGGYHRQGHARIVGWGVDQYEGMLNKIYTEGIDLQKLDVLQMGGALVRIAHGKLYDTKPVSAATFIPRYLREPDAKTKKQIKVVYEKDKAV
ncbi:MAG: tRNA (adenosine(37)-N6)-threonylcarbamoyltransferase complex dimerization subunit type 1 TsaB [Deltaproteobacteria bacterium]|nr:tRNA (adenosine(37)-N6)-threonylcarbamoyltransferase complex dimerization subunit type 1 TsaB [Deltaproteobacteria bacterium]MCL5879106.1 tRNA (adenosine(37)-N6)-threonylcarbamoyltransferase complex dimerization subunit type 1 TsaB [Deltaproteobacteria bacterium]